MNLTALTLAFLGLVGLCLTCWLVLVIFDRRAKLTKRTEAVVTANAMRPIAGQSTMALATRPEDVGLKAQVTGLLGFNLGKQDQYVLPWYVALMLCVLPACAICWVAQHVLGSIAIAMLPLVWLLLCRMFFGWCINRRKDKLFRQFPDALGMIVRSVRVGIPVSEAIRAVAREVPLPTGPEFGRLADEVGIGVALDRALMMMAERNDLSEYRFFATALSLQAQTGGGLSETLENLSDVIRKRVALRERGRALASEARTSAGILAALPPLTALGLWVLNPDYVDVLFTDHIGQFVLAAAVLMLGGGIMTMRTIIQKSLK